MTEKFAPVVKEPCPECAFRRDIKPGALGGSAPEVYVGQAEGHFMVPCHMHCDFSDPHWRDKAFETPQCAGLAVYRANQGLDRGLPDVIQRRAENRDLVFASHAEFYAHHKGISMAEAEAQLRALPPKKLLAMQLSRPTTRTRSVK